MNGLQKALKVNAIFSSISGVIMILLNKQLANLFGVLNNIPFWIIGLVLVYFALTICYEIKKQRRIAIMWIVIQDVSWVLGSVFLLIFNPFEITYTGNLIIGIIALIVLFMAINQLIALKKHFPKSI